jgi:membrane-associated phospholipid phosphatase
MMQPLGGSQKTCFIVVAWLLAGVCCLPIDVPLARAMLDGWTPGELRAVFRRGEVFGHAYGALAIVITIYVLDPRRRSKLLHVPACYLAGGLAADLVKLQVARMRPYAFVQSGEIGSTYLGSVWTTPAARHWPSILDHARHSFPSAHTAGAVAMAYSLGRLYPRGRWWFNVLAVLCAMNRIDGGAHFASDVCWGAALGYLMAHAVPSADRLQSLTASWRRQQFRTDGSGQYRKAA